MNVRRFVGRNAREAMSQVRAIWGDDAVLLSNRPVPGGVEILAMATAEVAAVLPTPAQPAAPMSTVSFQQFVRERQRQDDLAGSAAFQEPSRAAAPTAPAAPVEPARFAAQVLAQELAGPPAICGNDAVAAAPQVSEGAELMAEIRSMRSMIASQLDGFSWFDTVRRSPAQTQLLRLMIGNGFSPGLARGLVDRLPPQRSEAQASQWLVDVLAHNLRCVDKQSIQEQGGVYALVGPTGVGKTTTTAKIAARFAMEHGPASVGLITVDTYRMAASDQLRAFGRLLNIPVHTARDGASLAELLDLFVNKKLVLIDTVGISQRDRRLAEMFAALPAARISRLLVLNASAQGETLDEVVQAYSAGPGTRCVISKLDEAVKCGATIDVAIRHRLLIEGFANGQRVPQDWHAARAPLLAQKALMKPAGDRFLPNDAELGLLLTAVPAAGAGVHGIPCA